MIRRTRIPRESEAKKETRRAWEKVAEAALRRDRYECQYPYRLTLGVEAARAECHGKLDPHHILPRGRGGEDEMGNLVTLCRFHHDHVHAWPEESEALGLLAHSWDSAG